MIDIFVPKNGAVIDLVGLKSIEQISSVCLEGYLKTRATNSPSLILDGLEPSGRDRKKGPPRYAIFLQITLLQEVILPTKNGQCYVVRLTNHRSFN